MLPCQKLAATTFVKGLAIAICATAVFSHAAQADDQKKPVLGHKISVQPAAECSFCTRRHQALAKAKKRREKEAREMDAATKKTPEN